MAAMAVVACGSDEPQEALALGDRCDRGTECAEGLDCRPLSTNSPPQCTADCSDPGGSQQCQAAFGSHSVCYLNSCARTCFEKCPDLTTCGLAGVCLAYY